jgi:hypothetical protein
MNQQVTDYINNAPPAQKEIMNAIRELIHQSVYGVIEEFKWRRPVFRLTKDFAYLLAAKDYVTLGFFNFEKINDKQGKLEGTGKGMRHIKLRKTSDIDRSEFTEWLISIIRD